MSVRSNLWDEEPFESSVQPLAELLHDHTYLTAEQSERLARRILDLAAPDGYGE